MTAREKAIEAAALREQGLTYQAIADRLSVSCSTAYRWLNPEKTRIQQARYIHDECPGCDGQKRKSATLCRSCRQAERDERDVLLSRLWGQGLPVKKIADAFGITSASAQVMIVRRRQAGVYLPQRFAPKKRIESALLDRIEEKTREAFRQYDDIDGSSLQAFLAVLSQIRAEAQTAGQREVT